MPEAGVPAGDSPVSAVEVYRTGRNKAAFTFDSEIGANWQHDVGKVQVDEATRTITIPWRVYRPNIPSLGNGLLSYNGRDFRLPEGTWKVHLTDAITGRVLKRSTVH